MEGSDLESVHRVNVGFGGNEKVDDLVVAFGGGTVHWSPEACIPVLRNNTMKLNV